MKKGEQVFESIWVEIEGLGNLKVYQLEIRDLFLNDYKSGFKEETQELFIELAERRHK
jgi:hypothetical protein